LETGLLISSGLLWMIVLLTLILCLALVRRERAVNRSPLVGGLKPGTLAPDFTAHTACGEMRQLSDYRGKKTAFVFFTSHCSGCRTLLASLAQMNTHQPPAFSLVLVSGDEVQENATALVAEMDLPYPLLLAPKASNPFFTEYAVTGTPSYCFVNQDGNVHASGFPLLQSNGWKELTDWVGSEVSPPNGKRR
jgi:peroxiredoxin